MKGTEQNNKLEFFAIAWNRLIGAGILLVLSLIYAKIFTTAFLSEEIMGNWLFLGGPSLWWATSFLNTLAIGYLVIYTIFTNKRISISTGSHLNIKEHSFWRKEKTEFLFDTIQSIQISTSRIGGKNLWILFFGFQIWYLVVDGLAWVSNPFAFGYGKITGWIYLIQATVDLIALLLIIFIPPIEVKFYTPTDCYLLLIAGMKPKYYQKIFKIFRSEVNNESELFPIIKNPIKKQHLYFGLGIITLIISIIGKATKTFVSDPLSISLLLASLVWINNSWNYFAPNQARFPRIQQSISNLKPPNAIDKPQIVWDILIIIDIGFWIGFGIYSLLVL